MLYQLKAGFLQWTGQVKYLVFDEVVDLDPQEYCIGAVLIIAVGFALLSGRR